jgi:hypothetical protein
MLLIKFEVPGTNKSVFVTFIGFTKLRYGPTVSPFKAPLSATFVNLTCHNLLSDELVENALC